jgi:glycolate oxidase iron-sulfur subunit
VARLCGALGIGVTEPAGQGCCGSLHAHAGDAARASALAAANREALADSRTVLTLASGCHEAVGQAMAGTAKVEVVDAIAYLEQRADRLRFHPCTQRVALHLPCTQRNVVGSDVPLQRLLARIEGLDVVPLDAGSGCCGAAGIQMLDDPGRAAGYRQPMLDQLDASRAGCMLSANIGCRLHLANGTTVPVLHPLEFLAGLLDAPPTSAGSAGS